MAAVPEIESVKYNTAITTAKRILRILSAFPMFFFIFSFFKLSIYKGSRLDNYLDRLFFTRIPKNFIGFQQVFKFKMMSD